MIPLPSLLVPSLCALFQGDPSFKLSGALPPGIVGEVWSQALSPDGARLVYRADEAASPDGKRIVYLADKDVDERIELYSVAPSGGPSVRLDELSAGFADVKGFRITADSGTVVYLADASENAVFQLGGLPCRRGRERPAGAVPRSAGRRRARASSAARWSPADTWSIGCSPATRATSCTAPTRTATRPSSSTAAC